MTALSSNPSSEQLRIMIVDDSAVVRGMLTKRLAEEPDFMIASSAIDGVMALAELKKVTVDVVILDIEMPRMDGLTALPLIRQIAPDAKVIISSSLSERNAEIAIKALSLGASECIAKPSSRQSREMLENYYRDLIDKTRALGARVVRQAPRSSPAATGPSIASSHPLALASAVNALAPAPAAPRDSRSEIAQGRPASPSSLMPALKPHALAIASSTGGPQALIQIFREVGTTLKVPVFITQHMPPTFTAILAKHISQASGAPCTEGEEGEAVEGGKIYVAPGDYHMRLRREGDQLRVRLGQEAPVNYCRPSADPMIASLADLYGNRLLLVVLTGMGQDGMDGARIVQERGGTVIAQDKATSTVWGMPKAVAEHGYCRGLLPLSQIAGYLKAVFGGAV